MLSFFIGKAGSGSCSADSTKILPVKSKFLLLVVNSLYTILRRRAKKECNEHFSWEKLRRAELDMDRVRQWLKLDELLEKERQASLPWARSARPKSGGGGWEGAAVAGAELELRTHRSIWRTVRGGGLLAC
jgi:hypothetical protein